jgi:hypothetical protein
VQNKKKKLSCDSGCRLRVHGTCDKHVALVFAVFSSASLQLVHCLFRACAQNTLLPRALHTPTACDGAIQLHVTCLRDNMIWGLFKCVRRIAPTIDAAPATAYIRQLYSSVVASHHSSQLLFALFFWAVHSETAQWQCFHRQLPLCA